MGAAIAGASKLSKVADVTQVAGAVRRKRPRVGIRKAGNRNQQLVITTMVVVVGLGVLSDIVCKGKNATLPSRQYWLRIATLGFILALITELQPKLGKNFSYLVLISVLFNRSYSILQCLYDIEKDPPEKKQDPNDTQVSDKSGDVITIYTGSPQTGQSQGSTPSTPGTPDVNNPKPKTKPRTAPVTPGNEPVPA